MMADAYLLDLTRSMRRAGLVATGIDRVERAYLREILTVPVPVFGLVRTAFGYLLLDRDGLWSAHQVLFGQGDLPDQSILSRMARGRRRMVAQAETALRRLATARSLPGGLARMLKRRLKRGFVYLNVGHSNLTDQVFRAVRKAGGHRHVLLHDTIPVTFPQFQKQGAPAEFAKKLSVVHREADQVICPSSWAADCIRSSMERQVPVTVAPLGVEVAPPEPALLPDGPPPTVPYFVTVGTIEPRKNHAFLLDLWARMGSSAPRLYICGGRGWNNRAVFDRLDALPPDGPIVELNDLPDGALSALVQGSAGALFPTLAEGFGLPPVEARMLGSRVLCNDLDVLRENLGDEATFLPVSRPDLWLDSIHKWEQGCAEQGDSPGFSGPGWQDHFRTVFGLDGSAVSGGFFPRQEDGH